MYWKIFGFCVTTETSDGIRELLRADPAKKRNNINDLSIFET